MRNIKRRKEEELESEDPEVKNQEVTMKKKMKNIMKILIHMTQK